MNKPCPLCATHSETVLWNDDECRVILIDDPDYAGFCRVIWNAHVKEMTDLAPEQRDRLMRVVFAVEMVLRELLNPAKINLASLGNQTPHLHWHMIPRFEDDAHFPDPVWAKRLRAGKQISTPDVILLRSNLAGQLSAFKPAVLSF